MVKFFGFGGTTVELMTAVIALTDNEVLESAVLVGLQIATILVAVWSLSAILAPFGNGELPTLLQFNNPDKQGSAAR